VDTQNQQHDETRWPLTVDRLRPHRDDLCGRLIMGSALTSVAAEGSPARLMRGV